jgi:hypothetical protein
MSKLSSLLLRSSVRPSGQDGTLRQRPPRTVSWNTHIEVWRQPARSITWSTQVEVFTIPAREERPSSEDDEDDCDQSTTRTSFEDNEGITASPCEDDPLTPYTWRSNDSRTSTVLKIKRHPPG